MEEDYIVLEALITRTDVQCSQHTNCHGVIHSLCSCVFATQPVCFLQMSDWVAPGHAWVAKDEQEVHRSMPKAALYRLTWVGEHQIYAWRSAHNNEQPLPVNPGSIEWFS